MGQHRAAHRRSRYGLILGSLGVTVVVVLAGWAGVMLLTGGFGDRCEGQVTLTVAAAPGIEPAVAELAGEQPERLDGRCVQVDVQAHDSSTMAATLATPNLDPGAAVWIPESTMQVRRAAERREGIQPQNPSLASTPVVFAVAEADAEEMGWPGARPDWSELVDPEGGQVVAGTTDPTYDPAAAAALLGIQAAVPDAPAATAALRSLSKHRVDDSRRLFEHLPDGELEPALSAFPASEQRVLRHNQEHERGSALSVVASYPAQPTPWLDFPFVVLPGAEEAQRRAADRLLSRLREPAFEEALGRQGLRTADGRLTGSRDADNRIDAAPRSPSPQPSKKDTGAALERWAAVDASGRVLTVIDVSGSMATEVPGTGRTRMQVTIEAAKRGTGLFKPSTEYALWEFSTKLEGDRDYRQVAPWKPMSKHAEDGLTTKLDSLLSQPQGATGLYDTTLAAYREATESWKPGRTNVVIIMTDGRNEDDGITREQLLGELRKLSSPQRPLPIVFIGLGTDVDPAELNDIAKATGGFVSLAPQVTDIEDIFFSTLSKLRCPTGDC
ncbi:substrate-binding domain-containing protein [Amycolatopsis aidingensis]|uniref:substrate-binding domain-containing protein n=1 Tax=Amycolatopsis aidingensis TaxID=2842453 RepID=UPI001C0B0C4A|nr:substrate-binding domain-containing protein [Amycolatopsis aidingensis]